MAVARSRPHRSVSPGARAGARRRCRALGAMSSLIAALGWIDPSALCVLPALALALVLALRRYPGERMLAAARSRRRPRRRARRRSARAPAPAPPASGRRAAACCSRARCAVRPPPAGLSPRAETPPGPAGRLPRALAARGAACDSPSLRAHEEPRCHAVPDACPARGLAAAGGEHRRRSPAPKQPSTQESGNPINDQGASYHYRTYITSITPKVPGLSVEVLEFADRLLLRNHTGKTVTVYGYSGEPYARVLPNGTLEQNTRSPAVYLNTNFYAQVTVPPSASASAPRRRGKRSIAPAQFEWHDHRIHWMSPVTPPQVKDTGKRTKIFDWSVPIRVGDQPGAINGRAVLGAGELEGAPPARSSRWLVIVCAGWRWSSSSCAGGVAVTAARRRPAARVPSGLAAARGVVRPGARDAEPARRSVAARRGRARAARACAAARSRTLSCSAPRPPRARPCATQPPR